MALPQFVFSDSALSRLQTSWTSQLNPLLSDPLNNHTILKGVKLVSGTNVVNHTLGKMQQGWIISDLNAAVTIYRSSPFNSSTLTLTASGPATVTLVVY